MELRKLLRPHLGIGMRHPTLSIGLPVYNGEDFLEESLKSILAQDFDDFELIVSDNASTDKTADIYRDFAKADSRVRYVRQTSNVGAAPNYNLLVPMAKGRYFKWAAHDDNLLPGFLSSCITALKADPEVVLAYPLTSVIDGRGEEIGTFNDNLDLPEPTAHERFVTYLQRNFMRRRGLCNPIFGVMQIEKLKRTRMIQDFLASDLILLAHLSLLGKFVQLPSVLFERRVHAGISTAAHANHSERRAWFNTSAKAKSWLSNNELALRMTHIQDLYAAIGELVDDPAEKQRCRRALTRLLITDPKWLYIDIKYSLGLRPNWSDSAKKIASSKNASAAPAERQH
ncbi:glycosyltransferase family 2 protein [Rhodobacteraceae bacterium NNCM2]|nr:glycosyltransferase family 2 protein [Coraliihabitans acroporae]